MDDEKPLSIHKERLIGEPKTFSFVVDEKPTRAGIDPCNKLTDRVADDNMIDVTTKGVHAHHTSAKIGLPRQGRQL